MPTIRHSRSPILSGMGDLLASQKIAENQGQAIEQAQERESFNRLSGTIGQMGAERRRHHMALQRASHQARQEQNLQQALMDYESQLQQTEFYYTRQQNYRIEEINGEIDKIHEAVARGDIFEDEGRKLIRDMGLELEGIMSRPARRIRQKPKYAPGQGVGDVWENSGVVMTRDGKGDVKKLDTQDNPMDDYWKKYQKVAGDMLRFDDAGNPIMPDPEDVMEQIRIREQAIAAEMAAAMGGMQPGMVSGGPGAPMPGGKAVPMPVMPPAPIPSGPGSRIAPPGPAQPPGQPAQPPPVPPQVIADESAPQKLTGAVESGKMPGPQAAHALHKWATADEARLKRADQRWRALLKASKSRKLTAKEKREMWMYTAMLSGQDPDTARTTRGVDARLAPR